MLVSLSESLPLATAVTVPPDTWSEKTQYTIRLDENCGSMQGPSRPTCPPEFTEGIPVMALPIVPVAETIRILPAFSVIRKRPPGRLVMPQGPLNAEVTMPA